MSDQNIMTRYVPIVRFLSKALGPNCEVVLHDFTDVNQSVIAIENNEISGRCIGSPPTNLLLELLKRGENEPELEFICNYRGSAANGKDVKGSTLIIRNGKGTPIGALCINLDVSNLIHLRDALDRMIHTTDKELDQDKHQAFENLNQSIHELTSQAMAKLIQNQSIPPERLSTEEKKNIVSQLNDKGLFLLKGAVNEVAKTLKTSEPTIYRYLSKLK
ncbi:MAG: PAS domain-containing protein [Desulfobacterales bacterium]|nr:PAS domain-containing protein [Desulfobacterales bacterium]